MTAPRTVTVTAGSRLHFGLFAFDAADGPSYGGVGAMIAEPKLQVRAEHAASFSARGPLAERAAAAVTRLVESGLVAEMPRRRVEVLAAPVPHSGLGSGTQLSLAAATAVVTLAGGALPNVAELAQRLGRGRRSAIGTYGFAQGGLLVDSGRLSVDAVAPLAARVALPDAWRVLLLLPSREQGLAGDAEERAFARLAAVAAATTAKLRQLALEEIVPAASAADLNRFAAAVSRFNRLSGECFAAVQGGPYSSPLAARWVERLGALGAPAGQSSWGPTLFAFAADELQAVRVADAIRDDARADGWAVRVVRPLNAGASIDVG